MRHLKFVWLFIFTVSAFVSYSQSPEITRLSSELPPILEVKSFYFDEDGDKIEFTAYLDRTNKDKPIIEVQAPKKDFKSGINASEAACRGDCTENKNQSIEPTFMIRTGLDSVRTAEDLRELVVLRILKGTLEKSNLIESGVCIDEKHKDFKKLTEEQQDKIEACEVRCFEKPEDDEFDKDADLEDQLASLTEITWEGKSPLKRIEACAAKNALKLEKLVQTNKSDFDLLMDKLEEEFKDELASGITNGEAKKLVEKLAATDRPKIKGRAQSILAAAKVHAIATRYETAKDELEKLQASVIVAQRKGEGWRVKKLIEKMEKVAKDFEKDNKEHRTELDRLVSVRGRVSPEMEKEIKDTLSYFGDNDGSLKQGVADLKADIDAGKLPKEGIVDSYFQPAADRSVVASGNNPLSPFDVANPNGLYPPISNPWNYQLRGDQPWGPRIISVYDPNAILMPTQLDLQAQIQAILAAGNIPIGNPATMGIPAANGQVLTLMPGGATSAGRISAAGRVTGFTTPTFQNLPSPFVASTTVGQGNLVTGSAGLSQFDNGTPIGRGGLVTK